MQLMKTQVDIRNLEEENVLEKELDSCFDAEYILSMFSDPNGKDITIPVILLNEQMKNKKEFIDVNIYSSWSAINGDMCECEAWLFLNIDFGDLGIMKFKFNLFDMNARNWIKTLFHSNGNAILSDNNITSKFDIWLSNIPLDIPLVMMTYTAIFIAKKNSFVGG